jgi:prepilin-type N-terminal cleavage/methylation domain-containing protein
MRRAEPGFTLLEVLVAMTLAGLIVSLLYGTFVLQVRLARTTAQRALEADAVRTATTVLAGEVRRTSPRDVRAVGGDSLSLRSFRGAAVVCAVLPAGVVVRYRGDRHPDPSKDSALWVGPAGTAVVRIDQVGPHDPAACAGPDSGVVQIWRTTPMVGGAGLALPFESGSYHFATAALRYRIGAAGRQPLTAELFTGAARFDGNDSLGLRLRLGVGAAPPLTLLLHHGGPAGPADTLQLDPDDVP